MDRDDTKAFSETVLAEGSCQACGTPFALRAVNAKLLAALIQCIDHPITGYERQLAREAIEEARK